MRPNTIHSRGPDPSIRRLLRSSLFGVVLGLAFLFSLNLASANTTAEPRCGADPHCGSANAVSEGVGTPSGNYLITGPSAPAAGALIYDDYKRIEDRARTLLKRNLGFRDDISPYQGANNFDKLVRQFDTNSGFGAPYDDPDPAIPAMTLQQRITIADNELAEARDLYAYLAVFASPALFRADDGSGDGIPDNDYKTQLCNRPETPNPVTNPATGEVADPIIDWCNFPARLQQSVREAAYLRMIFAQQFMVDALGLNFSAGLLGGEAMVKNKELPKLRQAAYQYEEGEKRLAGALGRVVGNGCYVSDFFSQTEWGLMASMSEKKQVAQHQIAVRLSYLDITTEQQQVAQQALARDAYRASAMEGYIKMAGMSGRAALPPGSGCASTPPANALVAQMAANLLETRARAREMAEGRNVFGFDITFTPTRPFDTGTDSCGAVDRGLYLQARCDAETAVALQAQAATAGRQFDENQGKLIDQILALNSGLNTAISGASGCSQGGNDPAFFACTATQIDLVSECDPTNDATFDACLNRPLILNGELKQARRDMRSAWLALMQAQAIHDNFTDRMNTETMRNTKVKSAILTAGQENSAFEAAIAAANCCAITAGAPPEYQVNPGAFVEAGLRVGQILKQAAHDMEIEDANSEAAVRNLFLDQAEARFDIDMAWQQYGTAADAFDGVVGGLQDNVLEAQRERAYLLASPANDPGYRMVRDSLRLQLAAALEKADRGAYLAARRAEYEYATNLSGSGFRISKIYKARTANDVIEFLDDLVRDIGALPGSIKNAEIDDQDFPISVAKDVLGLTDAFLQGEGYSGDAIEAERRLRFRKWVNANLTVDGSSKEIISFEFATNSDTKGILSRVKQQGYADYWLHKMAGVGQPLAANTGTGVNLATSQAGLSSREARISQLGQVELTTHDGCLFTYRLLPLRVMQGTNWEDKPTEIVRGIAQAGVNGVGGDPTRAFLDRPVAANWMVVIYTGPTPKLDVNQLNDIQLLFSTTYASRDDSDPPLPQECVRADF